MKAYLSEHPCVDCGQQDIRVLEFDHVDPSTKSFCVGRGVTDGRGLKSIQAEIAKCEVRCCNCHRIRTREEHHYRGGQEGASQKPEEDNPGAGAA
jgi:hypothetical protein